MRLDIVSSPIAVRTGPASRTPSDRSSLYRFKLEPFRSIPVIQAARHKEIRDILEREGVVSISNLARKFKKCPITIRRDFLILEKQGALIRTRGGATTIPDLASEPPPYDIRERVHAMEKASIAKKAAEFIKEGDTLIINAGTTMHELARHLRHQKNLQVVTNGLTVAMELGHSPGTQVLMIGGVVDFKKLGTVGPLAEETITNMRVTKAFLGMTGVSLDHGLFMHSPTEAQINALFVKAAREVTVVVDSSKFEAGSLFRVASLDMIDRIITDSQIRPETRRSLDKMGLEVVVVPT